MEDFCIGDIWMKMDVKFLGRCCKEALKECWYHMLMLQRTEYMKTTMYCLKKQISVRTDARGNKECEAIRMD
jgi:hypothetical protein